MPVTKVKLTICGSSYIVSTTDSEEYVNQLAERLDNDMTEIMTQNPSASVAASAVISAMVISAVGLVTHSGVLTTGIPCDVAAATSMAS